MTAMPHGEPHLRVVECLGCEKLQSQAEAMAVDMHALEVDLKKKRRRINQLETDATEKLRKDPKFGVARDLFEYWEKVTGKKGIWDPSCQRHILRALHTLTKHAKELEKAAEKNGQAPGRVEPDEIAARALACCFLGIARKGFIDPSTKKRKDRIGLVCKDGETLTANLDRYFDWCRESGREPVDLGPLGTAR